MDPPEQFPVCLLGQVLSKLMLKLNYKDNKKEIPGKLNCKICFQEEVEVAFVPCGHMITCISCAITFNLCPVCKRAYNEFFRVFIMYRNNKNSIKNEKQVNDEEQANDVEQANDEEQEKGKKSVNKDENPTGYEESAEDKIMFGNEALVRDEEPANDVVEQCPSSVSPRDFMTCNVCHVRQMGITFMPCGHVYTCIQCPSKSMPKCPVCLEQCFAQMHVSF